MKILYAIQGTGNGHLARSSDIHQALRQYGNVEVLVSGIQGDILLPFPVKYSLYGLSFIFGKHGGINKWGTFRSMNLIRLASDIFSLPVQEYDLVISDFEPISAWACRLHKKPCFSLSHQAAVLNELAPAPKHNDPFGKWVLKNYAPATTSFGFHFQSFDSNIQTPVIRKKVRALTPSDKGHYTVYLPSYDDNTLVKELSVFESVHWQVFSKHCGEAFVFKNITVQPIENDSFIESMADSTGVLCGAGFETPAEALYLGKKLLVIPMSGQYEQQCNAAVLAAMGIPVIDVLSKRHKATIKEWLHQNTRITVHYPDNAQMIVAKLMESYWASKPRALQFVQ